MYAAAAACTVQQHQNQDFLFFFFIFEKWQKLERIFRNCYFDLVATAPCTACNNKSSPFFLVHRAEAAASESLRAWTKLPIA